MSNEELVRLYKSGDKQALDKLLKENMGIVYKLANKFYVGRSNSIDKEDLIQEGFIGLILAADKYRFNVEHQCKFTTYAVYWIYHKMQRFVKTKNTNDETSLNTPVGKEEDAELMDCIQDVDYNFENVEEKIYNQELRTEMDLVMDQSLTLKEKEILKLRHGWDNNKCMSCVEIGDIFSTTRSHVYGIENRAYGKLRRTPWGAKKAREIYKEKYSISSMNINRAMEMMDFKNKYVDILSCWNKEIKK